MKKAIISIWFLFYVLQGFAQLNIIGLIPSQNSNAVLPTSVIEVLFDQPIASGTINDDEFVVRGSISGLITGTTIGDDTDRLVFVPTSPFHRGEVVTVTITQSFTAYNFYSLAEEFTYEFRVAGSAPPEDPMVFLENEVATGSNSFATVGDIDSDGDADIILLSTSTTTGVSWLENDGDGNFTDGGSINGENQANEALIFDKDNDGNVDILCKTYTKAFWLKNDGSESFTSFDLPFNFATTGLINSVHYLTTDSQDGPAIIIGAANGLFISRQSGGTFLTPTNLASGTVEDVYPADIDGDGDLDIAAVLLSSNQIAWFENTGNYTFSQRSVNAVTNPRRLYPIDLDGDGDMDMISNGNFDELYWHENDGAQSFTRHLIADNQSNVFYVYSNDFDGDGDNDIVESGVGNSTPLIYINDGSESFTSRFFVDSETIGTGALAADFDGDLDLDLLAYELNSSVSWYENSAAPAELTSTIPFANAQNISRDANISLSFDKNMDAATVNASTIKVWGSQSGQIEGTFSGAGTSQVTFNPSGDFFAGEVINVSITNQLASDGVFFAGSQFEFRTETQPAPATPATFESSVLSSIGSSKSSYAADIDGDGDLDMLSAIGNDVNWHRNDGNAGYSLQHIATAAFEVNYVTAGDIDFDGDMDLVVAVDDQIILYTNNGSEIFSEAIILDESDAFNIVYTSASITDLDGDGDLDILIGSEVSTAGIVWLENDGNLSFSKIKILTGFVNRVFLAVHGDLDSDGDLDIVVASKDDNRIYWIENDGEENFSFDFIQISLVDPTSMSLVDLDQDGDLDVVSSVGGEDRIIWWENDGSGSFSLNNIDSDISDPESVYVADVDGDGDLDVVAGSSSATEFGTLWYDNNGSQTFTKREISTNVGDGIISVLAADMDGDGDSDIISSSVTLGNISLHENEDSSLTVALTTTANGTTNTSVIPVSIDFGELVTGFDISNVSVMNGTKSNFVDNGDGSYDLIVTAIADGLVEVSVAAGVATDAAANANTASNTVEVTYDGTPPTVTVSTTSTDPTNSTIPVTITFNELVIDFDVSDVSIVNGNGSDFTDNGDGSYDLTITAIDDDVVEVSVGVDVATDEAGNGNTVSNTLEVNYDGTSPTAVITENSENPTNGTIPVTITFNELVTGFEASDVTIVNGNSSDFTDNNDGSYDLTVTPIDDGLVEVSVAAGVATDAAGNGNTVSNMLEVTYDGTPPTVAVSSTSPDPTNGTIPVTITFNELVAGFDVSDVTIVNGNGSDFIDNGDGSYDLTVTAIDDDVVEVSVAAGVATDAAGNGNTVSNTVEVTYDSTSPTVVVTKNSENPTKGTIPVTITFNELVTGFDVSDVTIVNGNGSDFTDNGDGSYDLTVTAIDDGLVEVSVAADVATDAAGNNNEVSNTIGITYDGTKPTVVVTTNESNPTNSLFIPITVTFSEIVIGFDESDLGTGGISGFTNNGDGSYDFSFEPAADFTYPITVPAGAAFDLAGNSNEVSNTLEVTYDSTSPTVAVTSTSPDPTNGTIPVTITFNELVTGFEASDVTIDNGTGSDFIDNGDGSYDLTVTALSDDVVEVSVAADVATDAAGNANAASNTLEVAYDGTPPTVAVSTTSSDPTNTTIPVTITFNEMVTGFDISDVTIGNGIGSAFTDNGDGSFDLTVTAIDDDVVEVSVAAGVATDAAGNGNTASNTIEVTYDGTSPTVQIEASVGNVTNQMELPITITFNELVTGFDISDVTVDNGTKSNFVDNGDGSYLLTVTALLEGLVQVDVLADVSLDLAGNSNEASNTLEITYDPLALAVLVTTTASNPTNVASIPIVIDFGEVVTGFDISDVTIENGNGSAFTDNGDGSYDLIVTALSDDVVEVSVAADVAIDGDGNGNTVSNTLEVTYDSTSPTVAVTSTSPDPTNGTIPVTITFNELVTGFDASDVTIDNGTGSDFIDNGDGSYDLTIAALSDDVVEVSVGVGVATDAAGNGNTVSNTLEVTYDSTSPTVAVTSTSPDPTNGTIPVTITFNGLVTGFDISDVTIGNGTGSAFTDNGDGSYDLTVTALSDDVVEVSIAADVATDAAGNGNAVSNTLEVTYDGTSPTVAVTSTSPDPTNGTIPVTITFNELVTGFDASDVTIDNGTGSDFIDNGDGSYDLTVTALSDDVVELSIAADVATDAAGNGNAVSNTLEVTYDGTSPTVAVTSTSPDPTNGTIPVTITFNELVTGFDASDVTIDNGTGSDFIDNGDGSYDLTVTALSDDVVEVSVGAGVATDAAGNGNTVSNTLEVTYDSTSPTVAVTSTSPDPTNGTIPVTITFNELVTGFDASDVTIDNGTGSDFIDNGDGSYDLTVTALSDDVVEVSVGAGVATDAAGNGNTVSNILEVIYDGTSPTVQIEASVGNVTNQMELPITITFNELVTGFDISDVTVDNGTKSNFVDNGDGSYLLTVTALLEGLVQIDVLADVSVDLAGNSNEASNTLEITYDPSALAVLVTTTASDPTNIASIPIKVDFGEVVTGFEASDITIDNGTSSDFTDNGDGSYDLTVTASDDGEVSVSIAADVANDLASNANQASNVLVIAYDGTAPTTVIETTASALTNVSEIPITIDFGEIVTGFEATDITIDNGTSSDFTDNGDGSFDLTVTASSDGDVIVSVAADVANDLASNANQASNVLVIAYDGTAPMTVIETTASALTNVASIPVTIDFGEVVTGFEASDITIDNGTSSDFTDNGDGSYDLTVTAMSDGEVSVSVAAGVANDLASNANQSSNVLSVTYDGTAPVTVIETTASALTNDSEIPITIDFGEIVIAFEATDITIDNGTSSDFTDNGDGSYDLTVTALSDGDVIVSVAAEVANDLANNSNEASNSITITYDGTSPTAVVASSVGSIVSEAAIPVTITFSEVVTGFEASDIAIANGSSSDFVDNGDGSYNVLVTALSAGLVSISVPSDIGADLAGNNNEASNAIDITYDPAALEVTISTSSLDPTNNTAIPVTIDFGEVVSGFEASDVTIANGTGSDFTDNDDGSFSLTVTPIDDGLVSVQVLAGVVTNGAGSQNLHSNVLTLNYDGTSPSVQVSTNVSDPTSVAAIPVTIAFSEVVTGFEQSDITVTNGTSSAFVDNRDGSFGLTVTASASGLVEVSVAAGVSTDAAGNANTSSNSLQVTYNAPNSNPTLVGAIQDQALGTNGTTGESVSLTLSEYFSDPDGDALVYTAESENVNIATASISSETLTIVAVDEGVSKVTVTADDQLGGQLATDFDVTVTIVLSADGVPIEILSYPNPVTTDLTVKSDGFHISEWKLYGLRGDLRAEGHSSGATELVIDVRGFAAGTYILKLKSIAEETVDIRVRVNK